MSRASEFLGVQFFTKLNHLYQGTCGVCHSAPVLIELFQLTTQGGIDCLHNWCSLL